MSFYYPHTCPDIDKNIESAKSYLYDNIESMLEECCPMLKDFQKVEYIKSWVGNIYRDMEDIFEGVRTTNQDMRSEADRQISALEEEIENLHWDVAERDKRIGELGSEIDDLENRILDYDKS